MVVFLKEGKKGILTPHSPQLSMRHSFTGAHAAPSSGLWAKLWHIEEVLWMVSRLLNRMGGGLATQNSWQGAMGLKSTLDQVWNPITHSYHSPVGCWEVDGELGKGERSEGNRHRKGDIGGKRTSCVHLQGQSVITVEMIRNKRETKLPAN